MRASPLSVRSLRCHVDPTCTCSFLGHVALTHGATGEVQQANGWAVEGLVNCHACVVGVLHDLQALFAIAVTVRT
jgi:hypothetical protein